MPQISSFNAGEIIYGATAQTGPHDPERAKAQRASLNRNRVILEHLDFLLKKICFAKRTAAGIQPAIVQANETTFFHSICPFHGNYQACPSQVAADKQPSSYPQRRPISKMNP